MPHINMSNTDSYHPPWFLRNAHIQSILASTALRHALVKHRARVFLANSREHILDCGEGVRLHGEYTPHASAPRGFAILIHGWHGTSESAYLLSTANHLYQSGFSIFRLHLRDHGPSHHLNREPFNSTRLREVVAAVAQIQTLFPHPRCFLGGYSLGGNFALRVAVQAPANGIALDRVVAVCPVLDPVNTMEAISSSWMYHRYFVRKWQRALDEKLRHFPELGFGDELLELGTMRAMNEYFVPRYTEFPDTRSYLEAYAITGERLQDLRVPAHIVTSRDDPVIPCADLQRLARPDCLTIELTDYGGHCGYLGDWRLNSWIDQRIDALFR